MQSYNITNNDLDENGYLIKEYPEEIQGYFDCSNTNLHSLKGVPKKIKITFGCSRTLITSLEDGPEWVQENYLCNNTKITSLKGAPQYVGGEFWCIDNKISSLHGIGRKFLKEVCGDIILHKCPIQSHVLGLLLVKNLKEIRFNNNKQIMDIINKHLQGDRDVIECQYELIQKGLKDYAKL